MKYTKESNIVEILRDNPELEEVFYNFGMGCIGCPSSQVESIEEACLIHGISVDELLKALNEKKNNE